MKNNVPRRHQLQKGEVCITPYQVILGLKKKKKTKKRGGGLLSVHRVKGGFSVQSSHTL